MSNSIGIDLGTTNSVVAFVNSSGKVEVIPSREGPRTTPSVFAVSNGEKIVGKQAVDQESMNAANTIRSIKRHMGTSDRFAFDGIEAPLSPEEISSEILKKLKKDAEIFIGEPVENAVITVPAYFNNDQRQATKTAGELAGLNVLRIINEPTAAALAYGLDTSISKTVLVYDLGGGTFDVTLLKISDGMDFMVQSTSGDTHLGGDDFDAEIEKIIIEKSNIDYNLDASMRARLRDAAEQAKKELSSSKISNVYIPYFFFANNQPVHISVSIDKSEVEQRIAHLVEKTKKCIESAIRDANITFNDIDEVVFVGGSTRIPLITSEVKSWTGKTPDKSINPDEAVAIGAAIQASILSGESDKEMFLFDVTPLSLGVETEGGIMDVLIPRNTHVPAEVTQTYTTAYDKQSSVDVRVFQGERPRTKDNKHLGEFQLSGIPPAPRGAPQIDVSFEIDANGILFVRACDKITGIEHKVTLTGNSSLSSDEIQKMIHDAEINKNEDSMFILVANLQSKIKDQIIQCEEILRTDAISENQKDDIDDLIQSLEDAKDSTQIELMTALAESADKTLLEISEYIYKMAEDHVQN